MNSTMTVIETKAGQLNFQFANVFDIRYCLLWKAGFVHRLKFQIIYVTTSGFEMIHVGYRKLGVEPVKKVVKIVFVK